MNLGSAFEQGYLRVSPVLRLHRVACWMNSECEIVETKPKKKKKSLTVWQHDNKPKTQKNKVASVEREEVDRLTIHRSHQGRIISHQVGDKSRIQDSV